MENNTELKVKNLMNLRTSLIAVVTVLTGGLISFIFTDTNIIFKTFIIISGVYFDILFVVNMINTNNKINKLLEG
ncbi:MAG: hypothetical protein LUH05_01305 [Candidatus Gastranaerophilales bacterium]|nr:hypothetical protein [Candidatus Gastranaerophilales bacterium]